MARLNAAPWTRYRSPSYPTRLEVMADRRLLARHVPPAWLLHRELAGAFGALLLAAPAGCTDRSTSAKTPTGKTSPGLGNAAIVAPIFGHGSGTAYGRCVPVSVPLSVPVFLSEEEALQVIKEELAVYGLNMSERDVTLSSVFIQGRRLQPGYEWASGRQGETLVDAHGQLVIDLKDPARKVAVEFIAKNDFFPLGGDDEREGMMSTKQVAASLAERVNRDAQDMYFGAFYDPVTHLSDPVIGILPPGLRGTATSQTASSTQPATAAEARAESKRLLRMQVRDFTDWLKAQGVI